MNLSILGKHTMSQTNNKHTDIGDIRKYILTNQLFEGFLNYSIAFELNEDKIKYAGLAFFTHYI